MRNKRFCGGGTNDNAASFCAIKRTLEAIPAVSISWRHLARILRQFSTIISVVSQTVSHWLSQLPISLLRSQLEMEARVGIGRLKRRNRLKNA